MQKRRDQIRDESKAKDHSGQGRLAERDVPTDEGDDQDEPEAKTEAERH